MNLKEWYGKPKPDDFRSLSKFLTEEEKAVLRKIKRQIRTFRLMDVEEYERLQKEYAEYVFSLIENFISEDDKDTIKAKIQEEVCKVSLIDFNNAKALSIAKRVYSEYNNISCTMDDLRAYRLDEEFYELLGLLRGDL